METDRKNQQRCKKCGRVVGCDYKGRKLKCNCRIKLTDGQRLEIAVSQLSEGNLENYAVICELAENGMIVSNAISKIGK